MKLDLGIDEAFVREHLNNALLEVLMQRSDSIIKEIVRQTFRQSGNPLGPIIRDAIKKELRAQAAVFVEERKGEIRAAVSSYLNKSVSADVIAQNVCDAVRSLKITIPLTSTDDYPLTTDSSSWRNKKKMVDEDDVEEMDVDMDIVSSDQDEEDD